MTSSKRDPDVCVVTCALSGVLANRSQCPNIPYTPAEMGEEAKRAYDAGASVVHIHARNDDGSPTARTQAIWNHTPMARFGRPQELVGAALFLASSKASGFVTGADLRVDGGFLAQTI